MKKITKATFKKFIRENKENLYARFDSRFDGMIDGHRTLDRKFEPAQETNDHLDYTFGIKGAWLVGHGGDGFNHFDDGVYEGIEVYNSCARFFVAVKK